MKIQSETFFYLDCALPFYSQDEPDESPFEGFTQV